MADRLEGRASAGDTYEDYKLEMELAEMMAGLEARGPEAYAAELARTNKQLADRRG